MKKRDYYSVRTGKITPNSEVNFDVLKKLFLLTYRKLSSDGYFQKYFGIDCTDGYLEGELGEDIDSAIFISLRKDNLFPIVENLKDYSEDDFFDILEFLFDHVSKGIQGDYHNWNQCGIHYKEFSDEQGQQNFREVINPILKDYKGGFEISEKGEIFVLSGETLSKLLNTPIPSKDKDNVTTKVDLAINKFRRFKSTEDDRREAIRELADVLEFLKPQIKKHLDKKDQSDLFNIINNFGIRHHNNEQKLDFDKPVWFSWMFHFYLATIHAVLTLSKKAN